MNRIEPEPGIVETISRPSVNEARTSQILEGRVEETRQSAVQEKIKPFMLNVIFLPTTRKLIFSGRLCLNIYETFKGNVEKRVGLLD